MAAAEETTPTTRVPVGDLFLDDEERYELFTVKAAERPHLLNYQEDQAELQHVEIETSTTEAAAVVDVDSAKRSSGGAQSSNAAVATGADNEEKKDDHSICEEEGDEKLSADTKCHQKHDDDDHAPLPPPLVDGCDLPGWRRHRLAFDSSASRDIAGLLNIGPGSTLFRRADQLSCPPCLLANSIRDFQGLTKRLASSSPLPEMDADVVDASHYAQMVDMNDEELSLATSTFKATRFAYEYERRNIPAKIVGATKSWKAMPSCVQDNTECNESKCDEGWTYHNLLDRSGDISWRFSDVHGEMLTLRTYSKYISTVEGMTDDSPLAIYDAEFGDDHSPTSVLLNEYTVPACFSQDLFDLALPSDGANDGSDVRPPYRWILIGPARSGTGLHVDPLWTNAWVTVLQGLKRWLLFPPCTPQEKIGMFVDQPQIPSSLWFRDYYHEVTSPSWPKEWKPVEVLQSPGETVFVPNGWPHLVLNLELTVAVTHNYASEHGPFERMWEEVASDEPEFARRWYAGMVMTRQDLANRVKAYHDKALRDKREWALSFGELPECSGDEVKCLEATSSVYG